MALHIRELILRAKPGAQYRLVGTTLAGLTWIGPGAAPTQAELDAAQAAYDAEAPTRAASTREELVFADLVRRMTNAGWTPDMAFARLLVDSIQRVPAGSRTAREAQFLTAVAAANAAIPP